MNEIYVVGHRNPDTDSIVAAMSYAALRNALGDRNYVAAYLGHVSDETQRLLNRFGFQPPQLIQNVRTQVSDLDSVADVLNHGDSSQSLEHSADTGCFLTDKVILFGDALIKITCMKHTDTNLSNNEVCTLKRKIKIVCHNNLTVNACFFKHTNAKIADDSTFSLVDIHKGYFFKLKRIGCLEKSVNKLRAIRAARTDYSYSDFFHM